MNNDDHATTIEDQLLPDLVGALNDNPTDYGLRRKIVSTIGDLGFRNHAITAACYVADDLVRQGYILPALLVLCGSSEYQGLSSAFIQERLRALHAASSASDEAMVEQIFIDATPLARKAITNLDPNELREIPLEEQVGLVVQFLSEPAIDACRGIAFPMPLFTEMSCEQFLSATPHLTCEHVGAGDTVIKAGDEAKSLLIIAHGEVNVTLEGERLARLGAGSVIGEMALFTRSTRRADVIATSEVSYIELQDLDALALCDQSATFREDLRRFCNSRMIQNLIRTSPLFAKFDLGTASLLAQSFVQKIFSKGDILVSYGEPGTGLWLIANGSVDVKMPDEMDIMTKVATLVEGDVFGEISLVTSLPATAQVVANSSGWALFLDKSYFEELIEEHPELSEYIEALGRKRVAEQKKATDFKPIRIAKVETDHTIDMAAVLGLV